MRCSVVYSEQRRFLLKWLHRNGWPIDCNEEEEEGSRVAHSSMHLRHVMLCSVKCDYDSTIRRANDPTIRWQSPLVVVASVPLSKMLNRPFSLCLIEMHCAQRFGFSIEISFCWIKVSRRTKKDDMCYSWCWCWCRCRCWCRIPLYEMKKIFY